MIKNLEKPKKKTNPKTKNEDNCTIIGHTVWTKQDELHVIVIGEAMFW